MTTSARSSTTPFERAAQRLETLVEHTAPGEQLPAERELVVDLGVSRLTVREALRSLSARGLITLRQGRRAVVREPDGGVLAGYFAATVQRDRQRLTELLEIRRPLEVLSASTAARAASRTGVKVLDRALANLARTAATLDTARHLGEGTSDALADFVRADVEFHGALSLVGGNRLLGTVLDGLADVLAASFLASSAGHFARGGSTTEVVDQHRAIVTAVAQGDVSGATAAMARHLHEAGHDLHVALERDLANTRMETAQ